MTCNPISQALHSNHEARQVRLCLQSSLSPPSYHPGLTIIRVFGAGQATLETKKRSLTATRRARSFLNLSAVRPAWRSVNSLPMQILARASRDRTHMPPRSSSRVRAARVGGCTVLSCECVRIYANSGRMMATSVSSQTALIVCCCLPTACYARRQ